MGLVDVCRWTLAAAVVLGGLSVADAQEAESSDDAEEAETSEGAEGEAESSEARDQEARALYQAGRVAFDDGRFEDALEYFERSHDLSGRPALLYNIGSAADRLRRNAMALEYFEAYLEAVPEAENRRSVEARIRVLQDARDNGTVVPTPEETARAGLEGDQTVHVSVHTEESRSRTGLWVGLGIGAAVLIGVAVVLAVVLRDPDPDYQPSDEGLLVFTLEQTP